MYGLTFVCADTGADRRVEGVDGCNQFSGTVCGNAALVGKDVLGCVDVLLQICAVYGYWLLRHKVVECIDGLFRGECRFEVVSIGRVVCLQCWRYPSVLLICGCGWFEDDPTWRVGFHLLEQGNLFVIQVVAEFLQDFGDVALVAQDSNNAGWTIVPR